MNGENDVPDPAATSVPPDVLTGATPSNGDNRLGLKNSILRCSQNKIAPGCPINDFLGPLGHFLFPFLLGFWRKMSFSTTTSQGTH
jgi:hypothetical protein